MRVAGVGCCVQDLIYTNVDMNATPYLQYIHYGELTDPDEFEKESGIPIEIAIQEITKGGVPLKKIGGVCVVSLIGVAQLLEEAGIPVEYYKNIPSDNIGDFLMESISSTPLKTSHLCRKDGKSAPTYVLCDNQSENGTRSFINVLCERPEIAMATSALDNNFFQSDFLLFNAMLWEPELEKDLTDILKRAKENKAVTLVGTASDPRYRGKMKWIMGVDDSAYPYIDILMMNRTEAAGYAGTDTIEGMKEYFIQKGVKAFIITDGRNPTYAWSRECELFCSFDGFVPVADEIDADKKTGLLPSGDGVGCGDNFDSGVIASLVFQKMAGSFERFDLLEAIMFGNISGGLTSCVIGGVYPQSFPGEKLSLCLKYLPSYRSRVKALFKN